MATALAAAVAARQFTDAARLQGELAEATAELGIAEASAAALRQAQASADADRQAAERMVNQARQHADAERALEDATEAETRLLADVEAALGQMRDHLAAAQSDYERACAVEAGIWQARCLARDARVALGLEPAPGVTPAKANRASALGERDALVRELLRWAP